MKNMPVMFVGHGSPMNAIEENRFSDQWKMLGARLPSPQAILCVSAHWFTHGSKVADSPTPKMIYDMYGFPDELYRVSYQAPGSPHFAGVVKELLGDEVQIDNSWGIDHGTWSVLCRVYPAANIPVFQLSVDKDTTTSDCFRIGSRLRALREQGVLIIGSGNVVHNLARIDWDTEGGYAWAEEFDGYIKDAILNRGYEKVNHFEQAGAAAALACPTVDHFAPLLYVLGAVDKNDRITVFNNACVLGSLSMTSYLFE